jgi:N-acetylneuraminic acid mutarotase
LPDPLGVAGAFVGESNSAILVAGGANFPKGPPWRGGEKVCSDAIHVLTRTGDRYEWLAGAGKLPHPAAYGVSITTARGVLFIGGADTRQCYADVRRATWSRDHAGVKLESLPPLPRPLAYMTGACAGDVVFIAGGQETLDNPGASTHFYTLDLSREGKSDFAWREQTPWPGAPRIIAVAAAVVERAGPTFYLFSGRDVQPGQLPRPLSDGFRFALATGRWEALPPIQPQGATAPRCVMAGAAIVGAPGEILLLGGDPGGLFTTIEDLRHRIGATKDAEAKKPVQAELEHLLDTHPGFTSDVLRFETSSRTYSRATFELPNPPPVTTTPCVASNGRLLLISGEIRPGVRTPRCWVRDARSEVGR